MRLEFFVDVYPWTTTANAAPMNALSGTAYAKTSGAVRYKVWFEIDDPIQPDKNVIGTAVKEIES